MPRGCCGVGGGDEGPTRCGPQVGGKPEMALGVPGPEVLGDGVGTREITLKRDPAAAEAQGLMGSLPADGRAEEGSQQRRVRTWRGRRRTGE